MTAQDCFTIGEWTLDTSASQLRRRGTEIHLEPRLTDLLSHFARNPDRVIPKEELIAEVWEGRILENAAVARAVAELRKALGDTARAPTYIETVPKRGYRLVARVGDARRGRTAFAIATGMTALVALGLAALWYAKDDERSALASNTARGSENPQALEAYERGVSALGAAEQSQNESAVVHLTRALELDPTFALAHAGLAEAYSVRATWYGTDADWADAALAEASRAVALAPDLPESHSALGFALSTNGRFRDAQVSYRRALELRRDDVQIAFRLGEVLMYRGELPDALATLLSLLPSDANDAELQCQLGTLLQSLGYADDARVWFGAALAAEPFHVSSSIRLALQDMSNGDLGVARSRMERLADAHDSCGACDQLLGEIALRQNRPDSASAHFARALERTVAPKSTLIRVRQARLAHDTDALRVIAAGLERELTAGVDIWFPAWLLAVASSELGDVPAALMWHREAISRGHLDWRADLYEPSFESLRDEEPFEQSISAMQQRIVNMRREIEDRGLLKELRRHATRLGR